MKYEIERRIKSKLKDLPERLLKNTLAVGLFGSIARDDFNPRSDIDIFIIGEKDFSLDEQHIFYSFFYNILRRDFKRDITILTYSFAGLKRVPTWHTLHLCKDAYLIYERGITNDVFKKILEEAEKQGIIWDEEEKVFRIKEPKIRRRVKFEFS